MGFELMGYDFMVDTDLKVWLIEINENPCLDTLSPEQGELINKLVDDTLHLTVDSLFGVNDSGSENFPEHDESCSSNSSTKSIKIKSEKRDTGDDTSAQIQMEEENKKNNESSIEDDILNLYLEDTDSVGSSRPKAKKKNIFHRSSKSNFQTEYELIFSEDC